MKNKLKYAGPPTLKKKSHSKNFKKNSNNVGPPTLHKTSDPMNLKEKLSNTGELLHLKSYTPSDGFQQTNVRKQHSQSTSARQKNQKRQMMQLVEELPVGDKIVDYPINLTGKGKFWW